ncbi:hypothetical protein [Gimesia sp.]|uniref:hypothetical protein n=1 Tax=Gimesia sp. TaxID=2024833 RepID=UPI0025C4ED65|nr:hypothetical protein [Gimesia sp.]
MRSVSLFLFCLMLTPLQAAEEKSPLESWVISGAEAREQGTTTYSVKEPNQAESVNRRTDTGQYLSEKPFQEVVAFYVKKSGFEPPNWSILGREFPGTDLYLPAHWTRQEEVDGKLQTVIIQHFIREQAASVQLLLTNQPDLGTVSISITRGKDDAKTLIQIVSVPDSDHI